MQGGARTGSERTSVRENRKRSDNAADASPQPFSDGLLGHRIQAGAGGAADRAVARAAGCC